MWNGTSRETRSLVFLWHWFFWGGNWPASGLWQQTSRNATKSLHGETKFWVRKVIIIFFRRWWTSNSSSKCVAHGPNNNENVNEEKALRTAFPHTAESCVRSVLEVNGFVYCAITLLMTLVTHFLTIFHRLFDTFNCRPAASFSRSFSNVTFNLLFLHNFCKFLVCLGWSVSQKAKCNCQNAQIRAYGKKRLSYEGFQLSHLKMQGVVKLSKCFALIRMLQIIILLICTGTSRLIQKKKKKHQVKFFRLTKFPTKHICRLALLRAKTGVWKRLDAHLCFHTGHNYILNDNIVYKGDIHTKKMLGCASWHVARWNAGNCFWSQRRSVCFSVSV